MKKYIITRTVRYTEEIEVEANSEAEAWELTQNAEFFRNHDNVIVDEKIKEAGS